MKHKLLIISFFWAFGVVLAIHAFNFKGSVPNFLAETGGIALLDVKPAFTPSETYERLNAFGEAGRDLYKFRLFTLDLLLPVSVSIFFALFAKYSWKVLNLPRIGLALLVVTAGFLLFDIAENASIHMMLTHYPRQLGGLATVTPYFSIVKRVSSIFALVTVFGTAIFNAVKTRGPQAA